MIKKWYSSIAIDLAKMVGVTDEMILENSNGVVDKLEPDEDELKEGEEPCYDNTLTDPKIFGGFEEDNIDKMGHLELPFPVVNIHYTRGKCPELPKVLNMSLKDVESLIYVTAFIKKEDDWNKDILLYPYKRWSTEHLEGTFLTGADAIKALLDFKGIDSSRYILNVIPVMPLCMRYRKCEEGTKRAGSPAYSPTTLDSNYLRTIFKINREKKLLEFGAPEIIMINERRSFQYKIDQLICNGAYGPVMERDGLPYEALDDLYDKATSIVSFGIREDPEYMKSLENIFDSKEVEKLWEAYEDATYEVSFDDDGYKEIWPLIFDTEEERNKSDESRKALIAYLMPLIKTLHEKYFSQYKFNEENPPAIVTSFIISAFEYWDFKKESVTSRLWWPILCAFDYYYRKIAMWENKTKEDEEE